MAEYEEIELLAVIENQEVEEENTRFQRKLYQYQNGFNISDRQFVKNFRLTKQLARNLIELVRPYVRHSTRESSISVETKVLVTLNFLGTGCYQLPIGTNEHLSVSQSSVSRCMHEIVDTLNLHVKYPHNLQELADLRQQFYAMYGMPGIKGCIDCTHVAIVAPPRNDELQCTICSPMLKILHVNARFPGSSNDAHIWTNSNIEPLLRNLYNRGHTGYFLLGDSGYPLRPWLLTPLANPQGRTEGRNNELQKTIRSLIERCIGVLKTRLDVY
ncbi:DDE superfamily endonuclease [Popillia japonica]|uniref:DDE superfamily endonuclease n=1 Tax=Popillia japonica TaxID=7064 RepID=A0AAW1ICS3_POPJA